MIAQGSNVEASGDSAVLVGRPPKTLVVPKGDAEEVAEILREHLMRGPAEWRDLHLIAWDDSDNDLTTRDFSCDDR